MAGYKDGAPNEHPSLQQGNTEQSKEFKTDKDGVVYPSEIARTTHAYLKEEGSMGFERNQAVKRESFEPTETELGTMGQHKLQRVKSTMAGSHAI